MVLAVVLLAIFVLFAFEHIVSRFSQRTEYLNDHLLTYLSARSMGHQILFYMLALGLVLVCILAIEALIFRGNSLLVWLLEGVVLSLFLAPVIRTPGVDSNSKLRRDTSNFDGGTDYLDESQLSLPTEKGASLKRLEAEKILSRSRLFFASLFWFAVLPGLVGVTVFWLVKGIYSARLRKGSLSALKQFGWVGVIFHLMVWVPDRLLALTFAIVGDFEGSLRAFQARSGAKTIDGSGTIHSAAAGALNVQLGGVFFVDGEKYYRPWVGAEYYSSADLIARTVALVYRGLVFWVTAIGAIVIFP
jgi:adenosylcobinamide-phosphate synthase